MDEASEAYRGILFAKVVLAARPAFNVTRKLSGVYPTLTS